MKLSKPQWELLQELSTGPRHVVDYFPPGKKLIELGLAQRGARKISFASPMQAKR